MICDITNFSCEFWDGDGCCAMYPNQCPSNSSEDVRVIEDWQARQVDVLRKEGE